ncbi:retrovirus-related Pol polyprotein from transposon 297 [Trichonephila clavipes]|nr:retrovirus-related Pol polyprotein from transposon 297 [Trichonephila clavipes]
MDLESGIWHVETNPEGKEKIAYVTGQGLGQFKVMPLSLCNAPETFKRLMETVLGELSYEACLVDFNDIINVGLSSEEHLNNIRRVLQKLKEPNLKLSPSKFHLFRLQVIHLDHIILAGRPLHNLTEAKQKFIWTDECNITFNKLKGALTSAPVLAHPETGKQFILDTDASHESIRAVLSQEIDGLERVQYFSQIARWIQNLQRYDVKIRYRRGSAYGNADAIARSCKYCSRVEKKFVMKNPVVRQVSTPSESDPWSYESVRKDQLTDPEIKPIIEFKGSSDETLSCSAVHETIGYSPFQMLFVCLQFSCSAGHSIDAPLMPEEYVEHG